MGPILCWKTSILSGNGYLPLHPSTGFNVRSPEAEVTSREPEVRYCTIPPQTSDSNGKLIGDNTMSSEEVDTPGRYTQQMFSESAKWEREVFVAAKSESALQTASGC